MTETEHGTFELGFNHVCSLCGQILPRRASHERRGQDEFLQWCQSHTICEPSKVKSAEKLSFPFVHPVAKTISEEWVSRETLRFLDEQTERQRSRALRHPRWRGTVGQLGLCVSEEAAEEVDVCVHSMLFGKLAIEK